MKNEIVVATQIKDTYKFVELSMIFKSYKNL